MALLAIVSCHRSPPSDALALVNGEAISSADVQREMLLLGMGSPAPGRSKTAAAAKAGLDAQVLEDLIDQALLLQEAARLGVALAPSELENQLALARAGSSQAEFTAGLKERGIRFEEWRDRIRRRALCDELVRRQLRQNITVKPQDLRDYYWEHVTQFRRSESVRLTQIFCGSRFEAEKALNELRLGESPAEVARRHSIAPEAAADGDMGWVQRKALPYKLEKAAFALKKGKFSDIIATPYGWHILYAADKRPEEAFSLEQSAPQIMEAILRDREQPLYRDWLASLRGRAEIRRVESNKGKP